VVERQVTVWISFPGLPHHHAIQLVHLGWRAMYPELILVSLVD
jgi:hypothetical protein